MLGGAAVIVSAGVLAAGCFSSSKFSSTPAPALPDSLIERRDLTVVPMTALNSPADDFALTMPLDTTIVLFTSARAGSSGKHSIYQSKSSGSTWTVPVLAVLVNNEQSNGMPSITPGGESMVFTGCDFGLGDCDIYRVDVGPRGSIPEPLIPWSIPTNQGIGVNGLYWDSQASISSDGSVLYFSSDRPGGIGGKDIWRCRRKRDGTWEEPVNAGPRVNTPFDEVTPWFSPDGKTLIFSSDGQPGLGGFDIFSVTEVMGVEMVSNLGTPINSSADEIAFSFSADGRHSFFASNRSGGAGGYDIYTVTPSPVDIDPLEIVSGVVRGIKGKPVFARIEVVDLTSSLSLGTFSTDPYTGRYAVVLPRGYNYALTAQAPGYLFSSEQVLVPADLEHDASRVRDFTLQPINGSVRLLLFFKDNDRNLERESMNDLDHLAIFLLANPTLTIEIAGHTDNQGDAAANIALSTERAQAVKSYLVGNRVDADRIRVKGYGSSQPISSNDTEEGRALNRRVEMRVIGKE
jgi:outer membrane protein OmpA-like peptidoglycan-associated protein/Tol biopolymer transport system component